jgi:hypothetical protein
MSTRAGLKSPTLSKLGELCEVLGVHPPTVLALALALAHTPGGKSADKLIVWLKQELDSVLTGAAMRGQ